MLQASYSTNPVENRIPGRHFDFSSIGCRFGPARDHAKIPAGGVTLERLVFEVEQEVPRIRGTWLCQQGPVTFRRSGKT